MKTGEQLTDSRPTSDWNIYYNEGLSEIISARTFDEAKQKFTDSNPDADIHGVARMSYVDMFWIGATGEEISKTDSQL